MAHTESPSPKERVALAEALCADHGGRMTRIRRHVLLALWQLGRPAGAYELMEKLDADRSVRLAPPTIYRALAFLVQHRLVARIQTLNAYVPCAHPEHPHDCLFFLCRSCGTATELEDPQLEKRLARHARAIGFVDTRRTIEVEGLCPACNAPGDPRAERKLTP